MIVNGVVLVGVTHAPSGPASQGRTRALFLTCAWFPWKRKPPRSVCVSVSL